MRTQMQAVFILVVVWYSFALPWNVWAQASERSAMLKQPSADPQSATSTQPGPQKPGATLCALSDDDYAVFTAVLEGLGRPEDPEEAWNGKEILVVDVTRSGDIDKGQWNGWGFRSNSKAAPSAETRSDFESKAKDECTLKEKWGDPQSYQPLSRKEVDSYFDRKRGRGRDGWKDFYDKHPHAAGFWTFSRPGYDSAKHEALLYVTHSCGWLCGTGHLYLLTRKNGRWKVENRLFLWIS